MENTILEVKNLVKSFDNFTAVKDISFSLKEGEILGFLGPNGAGKTTTIQMLLGVLRPTSGSIAYFGKNFVTHRQEILEEVNFSSTYTNLPWNLTVKENLTYISFLYAVHERKKRISKVVEIFKLEELLKKQMHQLSAGQQTRVNLAKAFINLPKVLLLDEPTASLDPDIAKYIRDFLKEQRKEYNLSIIITSHNMAEVEEVCDRVVFINHGEVIANDKPENLAKTIEISHIELRVVDMKRAIAYCDKNKNTYVINGKYIIIDVKEKEIPNFLRGLMDHQVEYTEISIEKPTLEDYFIQKAFK